MTTFKVRATPVGGEKGDAAWSYSDRKRADQKFMEVCRPLYAEAWLLRWSDDRLVPRNKEVYVERYWSMKTGLDSRVRLLGKVNVLSDAEEMAGAKNPEREIQRLRKEIRRHKLNYALGAPEVSDETFDRLMHKLATLETEHPDLLTPDSPTQRKRNPTEAGNMLKFDGQGVHYADRNLQTQKKANNIIPEILLSEFELTALQQVSASPTPQGAQPENLAPEATAPLLVPENEEGEGWDEVTWHLLEKQTPSVEANQSEINPEVERKPSILEHLKSPSYLLVGVVGSSILIALGMAFTYGLVWLSAKLYPIAEALSVLGLIALVLNLLPSVIFKSSRKYCGNGIVIVSYIWGGALWMRSILALYDEWGTMGIYIGFITLGVATVPLACLASLLKGEIGVAGMLAFSVVIVFSTRALGNWITEKGQEY